MVQVIQILGMIFAVFALLNVCLSYRKNTITTYSFILWSFVWFATLVVALYPNILRHVSNVFQIGRSIDALIYISIVVLFYLIFKIFVRLDDTNREMTKLVRLIALQNVQKPSQDTEKKTGKNERKN